MKILILSDMLPPKNFGGAGRVALNLACGLQEAGHEVFIITTCREKSEEKNINYQGLQIFRIYTQYHERWRPHVSLYNPQTVGKIKRLMKKIEPDIVHVHNIHYYLSCYCLKLAQKYSKAVFLTTHDVMMVHYGKWIPKGVGDYKTDALRQIRETGKRYNPFRNFAIRYFLKYVDKIFAVSNSLKEFLETNDIRNVETIHNGIDVEGWKESPGNTKKFKQKHHLFGKKIILFGGRLSRLKGGEQIIRAVAEVQKRVPEITLLVAGEKKGHTQEMYKLGQKLGVESHIIFTGWLVGDELRAAFHSSDIVTTPSIYLDPFPTVNLEAMACAKPVVGTCLGGTPEIVQDGITGYIINPLDVSVIADKINDLLINPHKAEQFGLAGYERIRAGFGLEQQVKETLFWYHKVLQKK